LFVAVIYDRRIQGTALCKRGGGFKPPVLIAGAICANVTLIL